jgi:hypothetical protein
MELFSLFSFTTLSILARKLNLKRIHNSFEFILKLFNKTLLYKHDSFIITKYTKERIYLPTNEKIWQLKIHFLISTFLTRAMKKINFYKVVADTHDTLKSVDLKTLPANRIHSNHFERAHTHTHTYVRD